MLKNRYLQVALDIPDLSYAVRLASQLSANIGCDHLIIEAGTPLIKAWGTIAVSVLKSVSRCIVFADTKTIDVGGLEAQIMYDNGADIISILGVSDESTVIEAVKEAEKRGKYVAVDLMSVKDPLSKVKRLSGFGVHIFIYHVGIDVQKKRGITVDQLLDEVREIVYEVKKNNAKCAVAGGLKPGKIRQFRDLGVDVVIVGSAITKSDDPVAVAKEIIREFI